MIGEESAIFAQNGELFVKVILNDHLNDDTDAGNDAVCFCNNYNNYVDALD
jgi:hypothetical protein